MLCLPDCSPGSIIVIVLAESIQFPSQATAFFIFACLLGVVVVVFALIARHYKYVTAPNADADDQERLLAADGIMSSESL
jgi:hypothetical protein